MAGAVTVEILGLPDAQRKLRAVPGLVRQQVGVLLQTTATAGQARAQSVAPVVTGALRAGITARRASDVAWVLSVEGPAQAYAAYVEYGTRYVSARGFMRSGKELMRATLQQGSRTLAQQLPGAVAGA